MQNKGGRKKGVLQKMWKWQIHTFLKELLDQRLIKDQVFIIFFKFSSANLMKLCIDIQWFLLQIVVVSPGTHHHES